MGDRALLYSDDQSRWTDSFVVDLVDERMISVSTMDGSNRFVKFVPAIKTFYDESNVQIGDVNIFTEVIPKGDFREKLCSMARTDEVAALSRHET